MGPPAPPGEPGRADRKEPGPRGTGTGGWGRERSGVPRGEFASGDLRRQAPCRVGGSVGAYSGCHRTAPCATSGRSACSSAVVRKPAAGPADGRSASVPGPTAVPLPRSCTRRPSAAGRRAAAAPPGVLPRGRRQSSSPHRRGGHHAPGGSLRRADAAEAEVDGRFTRVEEALAARRGADVRRGGARRRSAGRRSLPGRARAPGRGRRRATAAR